MFSLTLSICQGKEAPYTFANKIAAAIDTAGFITALVLGILTLAGIGSLPIASPTLAWSLTIGGVAGILIMAYKNIKSVDSIVIDLNRGRIN